MFTSTIDPALTIRPELVMQVLQTIAPLPMEITDKMFKNKKILYAATCTKESVSQIVQAIPYVGQGTDPPALNGKSSTFEALTVPPMGGSAQIPASEIKRAKQLKGQDYNAWLSQFVAFIKKTVQFNLEWYLRHFLATGSQNYKLKIAGEWNTSEYSLGTMTVVSAPTVKFDDTAAELVTVLNHLDTMYKAGNDLGWFVDPNSIITYARSEVFSAILNLMNGTQTNNVLTAERRDIDTISMSGYIIKRFDGTRKDPETQANSPSITAKQMRMVDTSAGAPHTLVNLELDNLNAVGGQSHVLVDIVPDPHGRYVDIDVSWRPLGLCIPEAIVNSGNCLA